MTEAATETKPVVTHPTSKELMAELISELPRASPARIQVMAEKLSFLLESI